MPVEYTACVASEKKAGKSHEDAQRICSIWFSKKFGISPQEAHKIGDWKAWKKSHGFKETFTEDECSPKDEQMELAEQDMKIIFAGTGSETEIPKIGCDCPECREARSGGKSRRTSPGILVIQGESKVAIDAGPEFIEQLERHNFKPDAIVLTHGHPDHTGGMKNGDKIRGIPVFATEETYRDLRSEGTIPEDAKAETWPRRETKKFSIGEISFEAFPVAHSAKADSIAYKLGGKVLYAPDFLGTQHWDKWNGVKLAVMDGSSLSRDITRHAKGNRTVGHMSMKNSGQRALAEGAERILFTHIGHVFHGHDGLKRKLRPHFGDKASVAFDGMEITIPPDGEIKLADEPVSGIYLVPPHGEMIWKGEKKAVVKSRPLKTHLYEPLYLASGDLVYGVIELSGGEPISLKQFEERKEKHRISVGERKSWWGDAKEFYYFDVKMTKKFDKPKKYKREKGVQTFIKEVKFGSMQEPPHIPKGVKPPSREKPKSAFGIALDKIKDKIQTTDILEAVKTLPVAKSVDLKILTNSELSRLHERVHEWYHKQIPKDWSLEDIVNLHQRIVRELERREMKHPWHGDGLDKAFRALPVKSEENPDPKLKSSMILGDLQRNLPEEITIENFVRCIGSVAEGQEKTGDCDILFQYDGRCFQLENKVSDGLGDYKIHVVADSRGAHGKNIPLYDLKLIKKKDFNALEPCYSLDERPILPSKPKRCYLSVERMRELNGDRELSIEPLVQGERLIAFKDTTDCTDSKQNNVSFYNKNGEEVSGLDELAQKIAKLTSRSVILDGFLQSDGTFVLIEPLKWSSTSLDFLPLDNRQFFLEKMKKVDGIKILPNFWTDNLQQFDEAMQKYYEGGETGVILKHRQSEYTIEGENPGWLEVIFEQETKEGEQPIVVGKAFNLMKAVKGYREEEYFKLDDLYKFWARGYFDDGKKIIVDPKFDGIRMCLHKKGSDIKIFTEDKKRDRAPFLPDMVADAKKLPADEIILDGEVTWWKEGSPIPRREMIGMVVGKEPIKGEDIRFNAFDALWHNKNLTGLPYVERLAHLRKILSKDSAHIKRVRGISTSNRQELEAAAKATWRFPGSEGSMLKVEDMGYDITGKRTMKMAKFKRVKELAVEVIGKRLKEPPKGARKPSATYLYRVAVKKDDKLMAIDAEKKITPKVIQTDQQREEKYRWQMRKGWGREAGDYDFGRTYASNINVDFGDIITVEPVLVRKWEDDKGQMRYSWTFPAVREALPEKKEPDTVATLERFVAAKKKEMKAEERIDLEKRKEETRQEAALKLLRQMGNPYLVEANYKKTYDYSTQHHIRGIPPDWTKEQIERAVYTIGKVIRAEAYENEDFKVIGFNMEEGWFDLQDKKNGKKEKLSLHTDFRMETNEDYLIGYTLATPASNMKPDKFNDNHPGDRAVAIRKAIQPRAWMKVEGYVKPGGVGATVKTAAYFETISRGKVIYGTCKDDFYEYRLEPTYMREGFKKERLAGRWVFSLIPGRTQYERIGEEKFFWQCWKPEKVQEWYAKTHDYEKELSKAKKDRISFIWQAPGVEMKRYDPPGLKRKPIEKRVEEH